MEAKREEIALSTWKAISTDNVGSWSIAKHNLQFQKKFKRTMTCRIRRKAFSCHTQLKWRHQKLDSQKPHQVNQKDGKITPCV